ncbi:MAG: HDIG domain-containing protein, partial [Candidatus Riflebacteria bacterium]|nr:HDIG domain-containing protein [Candidatus Riflebacteria bacterium]
MKNPIGPLRHNPGGITETTPTLAAVLLFVSVVATTLLLVMPSLLLDTDPHWQAGSVAARTVLSDHNVQARLPDGESFQLMEGEAIVRLGDVLTVRQAAILRYLADHSPRPTWMVNVLGHLLLVLLLLLSLGLVIQQLEKPVLGERVHACLLVAVILGAVLVTQLVILYVRSPLRTVAMTALNPTPAAVMLVSIFLGRDLARVVNVLLGVLMLCTVGRSPELLTATSLISGLFSLHCVSQQDSQRSDIARAGLGAGLVSALTILAFGLISKSQATPASFGEVFGPCVLGLANGLVTMVVVQGVMPLLEASFSVITTTKLQELMNPNHPLLQKLIREAPGTYHHSVNVAALAEAAAEEIGADPVLAKAGAYYHDVGKTKRPYFFIENQIGGVNYHDNLSPNLSRLIVHSHTRDGVEIARKHNLPKCITDIMAQHHGTDLVAFFYHRACQEEDPSVTPVHEDSFRYGGPKPKTPEAAIVMMADGVEAASRTLKKPTPASVESLVAKILNDRFADGQFDECDITKRELELIQAR